MNIKAVRFHQPVHLVGKQLTSINLEGADSEKYSLEFNQGLVVVVDLKAPKDKKHINTALIGLANVAYMISGSGELAPAKPAPAKPKAAPKKKAA